MCIEDFVENLKTEETAEDYSRILSKLNQNFKDSGYNPKQILEHLSRDRIETVGALLQATETRDIKLDEGLGRLAWRTVIEFYQEQGFNEELTYIEKGLYEVCKSREAKVNLEMFAEFIGSIAMACTFAIFNGFQGASDIIARACHKYVTKRLYPEDWKKRLKKEERLRKPAA